jgi:heat-inducible transcriptional repressor
MVDINERCQEVLSAIIEEYFITAAPVGSKFVADNCSLNLSPASIRNIMATLEDEDYLMQPHFSAGRVPTANGYKFYINSILKTKNISRQQKNDIKKRFDISTIKDIKDILKRTIYSLSDISHYTGVVLAPGVSSSKLLHIEFIKLNQYNLLVIMVFEGGIVENKVIFTEENFKQEELNKYSRKLNAIVEGCNIDELREIIVREMYLDKKNFYSILDKILFNFTENDDESNHLFIGNEATLFDEPEFSSYEKMRLLLKAFNDKKTIIKLLELTKQGEGSHIYIGSDTEWSGINGLTLITAPYHSKNWRVEGSIGIIGPARMNYSFVIPVVDYIAELLSEII